MFALQAMAARGQALRLAAALNKDADNAFSDSESTPEQENNDGHDGRDNSDGHGGHDNNDSHDGHDEHWLQRLSLVLARGQGDLVLEAVKTARKNHRGRDGGRGASAEWSQTDCQPCVSLV